MQSVWQLNNRPELLLFFSGWGMDHRLTAHLTNDGFDTCTCFNYNVLDTEDVKQWRAYDSLTVVAWSMGVWAAEQVLTQIKLPVKQSIAINGTPEPVNDTRGIPVAVAQGTLDGLTPESLRRFYRRMFGSGSLLKKMENTERLPDINFEERREELRQIISRHPYPETGFTWNKAMIGTGDAIFPPANMHAAWQGKAEIVKLDAPHYPFHLFKTWEDIIGE